MVYSKIYYTTKYGFVKCFFKFIKIFFEFQKNTMTNYKIYDIMYTLVLLRTTVLYVIFGTERVIL